MVKQDVKVTDNHINVAVQVCSHRFGMLTQSFTAGTKKETEHTAMVTINHQPLPCCTLTYTHTLHL